jgi:hypothetical protein
MPGSSLRTGICGAGECARTRNRHLRPWLCGAAVRFDAWNAELKGGVVAKISTHSSPNKIQDDKRRVIGKGHLMLELAIWKLRSSQGQSC